MKPEFNNKRPSRCLVRHVRRCPICGEPVKAERYMRSYKQVRCTQVHFGDYSATPMKTKKDAEKAWDIKFPPNVSDQIREE